MRRMKIDAVRRRVQTEGKPRVNWGKKLHTGMGFIVLLGVGYFLATYPNACMEDRMQRRLAVERRLECIERMQEERKAEKTGRIQQVPGESDRGVSEPK